MKCLWSTSGLAEGGWSASRYGHFNLTLVQQSYVSTALIAFFQFWL
jgi:hypothetical protein